MSEQLEKLNLKDVLIKLGNKLVMEYGFNPCYEPGEIKDSTIPIQEFTAWLNKCPEAQDILDEMGVSWPVVERLFKSEAERRRYEYLKGKEDGKRKG